MNFSRAIFLLSPIGVVLVWLSLNHLEPKPDWLQVHAPEYAVLGHPFPIHLQLGSREESGFVVADLHWARTHDTSLGYLGTGGAQPVDRDHPSYEFTVDVQRKPELRFVRVVVFLSPTGKWEEHTRVVTSQLIPVRTNTSATSGREIRLRLTAEDAPASHDQNPAAAPRLITGVLFLCAAIAAGLFQSKHRASSGSSFRITSWRAVGIVLLIAGIWELAGVELWLDTRLREVARTADVYYLRSWFQKALVSLIVPGLAAVLLWVFRARFQEKVLVAVLILYGAISATNLVSLHAIDRIADLSWRRVSLVQGLKLACVLVILSRIIAARTRKSRAALPEEYTLSKRS